MAMLEHLRESASQRLLMSETAKEREARLQILRENANQSLSSEKRGHSHCFTHAKGTHITFSSGSPHNALHSSS